MIEGPIATNPKQAFAATNEGVKYAVECRIVEIPAKSSVTLEMLSAFKARRDEVLHRREEAILDESDRAFQELKEREAKEEDLPVRLTRPQFFED